MKLLDRIFGNRKTGMRLSHVIAELARPMLITSAGWKSIADVVESKLANDFVRDFKAFDGETDFFGEPLPVMEVVNKVAHVPIAGPIAFKCNQIERMCGICDVGQLKRDIRVAREDSQVEAILIDVSTPGGSSMHVPETAAYIAETAKVKPVLAFTDDICASAGYYLIAGATEIYATPTAEVGSIGCYSAIIDYSEMYKRSGVKVELFASQKYKGMGFPGIPLSDEQRALIEQEVSIIDNEFRSFVKKHRPNIDENAMLGQTIGMGDYPLFDGKNKVSIGLVDYLVNDIDELIIAV
jgi:capsid assembly protease